MLPNSARGVESTTLIALQNFTHFRNIIKVFHFCSLPSRLRGNLKNQINPDFDTILPIGHSVDVTSSDELHVFETIRVFSCG